MKEWMNSRLSKKLGEEEMEAGAALPFIPAAPSLICVTGPLSE